MNKRLKKKLAKRYGFKKYSNPAIFLTRYLNMLFERPDINAALSAAIEESILFGSSEIKVEWDEDYQDVRVGLMCGSDY